LALGLFIFSAKYQFHLFQQKGMTMAMYVIMAKVKMTRMMIFTPEAIPIAT